MNKRKILAAFGILLGVVYLLNPTAGVIEIIPDNMPFVGNLDEVTAVILILKCLSQFGINLGNGFKEKENKNEELK